MLPNRITSTWLIYFAVLAAAATTIMTVTGFSSSSSSTVSFKTTTARRNVNYQSGRTSRSIRQNLSLFSQSNNNNNDETIHDMNNHQVQQQQRRRKFLKQSLLPLLPFTITTASTSTPTNAFDGGVGGLGKTKPEMGIQFINSDDNTSTTSSGNGEVVTNELLAPESGVPVLVSFEAQWPILKSSSNIESRDLANPEAAFVQVASKKGGEVLKMKDFFEQSVFGSQGKFGAYGSPTDIKVKRLPPPSSSSSSSPIPDIYVATFTTLTPAMRESERKVYISTYTIQNKDVFMLVVGTTYNRFEKREKILKRVAESFSVVEAPKSSLGSLNRGRDVVRKKEMDGDFEEEED